MNEWDEKRARSRIVWGLVVGLCLALSGFMGPFFVMIGAVSSLTSPTDSGAAIVSDIFTVLPILGWVIIAVCVGYGIYFAKHGSNGPARIERNAVVIAKLCLSDDHQTVFEPETFGGNVNYYVKIATAESGAVEYRCMAQVYDMCGEGMRGDAHVKGKWIGRFDPYIGVGQP